MQPSPHPQHAEVGDAGHAERCVLRLVELGEFLAEFILRDIGAARVENITAKEMG